MSNRPISTWPVSCWRSVEFLFPLLKCKTKGSNLSWSFTVFVSNTNQVNSKELEKCLTQRSIMTTRESVTKALTISQAVDGKDAFVKVTSAHCCWNATWSFQTCHRFKMCVSDIQPDMVNHPKVFPLKSRSTFSF